VDIEFFSLISEYINRAKQITAQSIPYQCWRIKMSNIKLNELNSSIALETQKSISGGASVPQTVWPLPGNQVLIMKSDGSAELWRFPKN
jgi:hypothetical protein